MPRWPAVALLIGACLGGPPAFADSRRPTLQSAVSAFTSGDDAKAERELKALLLKGMVPSAAASAHIYLGLIKVNRLQADPARDEFVRALKLDPSIGLPFEASPKAQAPFREARDLVLGRPAASAAPPAPAEPQPVPPSPVAPAPQPSPPPVILTAQPTPEEGPSHLLSISVGGVGLAGAAVGFVFLGVSAATLSNAPSGLTVNDRQNAAQASANQQFLAEVFLTGGACGVGLAAVLFVVELMAGHSSAPQAASTAVSFLGEGARF